jgi:hypothetical protein
MRRTLTLSSAALLLTLAGCDRAGVGYERAAVPTPTSVNITITSTATAKAGGSLAPFSFPPYHLAPAANRKRAAAILKADDAYYRAELAQGQTVAGTSKFTAWYDKAVTDVEPGVTAQKQANAEFTASDEPDAMDDWVSGNGDAIGDLVGFASDATGAGGPGDAAAREKMKADGKRVLAELVLADKDAAKVAAGK